MIAWLEYHAVIGVLLYGWISVVTAVGQRALARLRRA